MSDRAGREALRSAYPRSNADRRRIGGEAARTACARDPISDIFHELERRIGGSVVWRLGMGEDRRGAYRQNAFSFGALAFADREIECLIWDVTETGAQIEVEAPDAVPERFAVRLSQEAVPRAAAVAWRRDRRIGITFEG